MKQCILLVLAVAVFACSPLLADVAEPDVTISVDQIQRITIGRKHYDLKSLQEYLKRTAPDNIAIAAHAKVPTNLVKELVKLSQSSGATRISFKTYNGPDVTIFVDQNKKVTLGGKQYDLNTLKARLMKISPQHVAIAAHSKVTAAFVTKVINLVQSAGVKEFSLVKFSPTPSNG